MMTRKKCLRPLRKSDKSWKSSLVACYKGNVRNAHEPFNRKRYTEAGFQDRLASLRNKYLTRHLELLVARLQIAQLSLIDHRTGSWTTGIIA